MEVVQELVVGTAVVTVVLAEEVMEHRRADLLGTPRDLVATTALVVPQVIRDR